MQREKSYPWRYFWIISYTFNYLSLKFSENKENQILVKISVLCQELRVKEPSPLLLSH